MNSHFGTSFAPKQKLEVLSVEDGPRFSERVRRLLEAEGFALAIARVQSLAELERALDRQTWNLVLSDHSMPGFNPDQALELIKSRGLDLPFIIVSGYTGAADAALRARAHDYVVKTSLNRLGVAVRKALADAAERASLRQRERGRARLGAVALTAGTGDLLAAAQHAAHYDAMTGLPNRLLLTERLTSLIAESAHAEKSFALVYADLDDFRAVNDAFGHEAGDAVLRELGRRLGQVSASTDSVTRFSGDQFGIVFPLGSGRREAVAATERIIGFLKQPFLVGPQAIHLDLSMGIVIFPDHGIEAEALLEHAELAMFAAKRSQTRYRTYGAELDTQSQTRVALAADLRRALVANELVLYYQPQVDLVSRAVVGAEALLRWKDPHRGVVPPTHFIPLAEQSGLILEITPWVVKDALRQLQVWREGNPDLRVSVNVAMRNLHDPQFVENIETLVESSGVPARALTLEITEGTMMLEAERVLEVLHRFRKIGIGIAIDNFGTGYSSLSYLSRLPVDEIKIDKSFVMALAERGNRAIVESVIELGRAFDLRVVAGGLKNEATLQTMTEVKCPVAQGFHFSAPIPAESFKEWTQTWALA
ncbi:MAG TPA: EAL domain-containing protein [Candidatus Limnocylindria bacterium]